MTPSRIIVNVCWWCDAVSLCQCFFARRLQLWNKWSGEVWRFIIREPVRFPEQHGELRQITGEDIQHKHLRWKRLIDNPQLITSSLEHLANISSTCSHCSCMRWPGCLVIHNWWPLHMTVGNYRQSALVAALMQVHSRVNHCSFKQQLGV